MTKLEMLNSKSSFRKKIFKLLIIQVQRLDFFSNATKNVYNYTLKKLHIYIYMHIYIDIYIYIYKPYIKTLQMQMQKLNIEFKKSEERLENNYIPLNCLYLT